MNLDFVAVIPARFGSTRLPGKPLRLIAGRPMILHVIDRALQAGAAEVIVATDDQRIMDIVGTGPARAYLTDANHRSGTDRLAEVAQICAWPPNTIVVNLQGDEPFAPPTAVRAVAQLLAHSSAPMATLCTPITEAGELFSADCVKVILDGNGHAIYFSRAPIPYARDAFARNPADMPASVEYLRHIGIYAYRASFVKRFSAMPAGRLEQIESLEQLRAIENDIPIAIMRTPEDFPAGIDTEADLERVIAWHASQG